MKKIILILAVSFLAYSCGSTKIERQAERTFKGNWTLTDISYPSSDGFVDVTLFNDASSNCFENSEWNFISNNNKGTYNLYKDNCAPGTRNFVWSVQEIDQESGLYDFTLKVVKEGESAQRTTTGYRMSLVSLSDTDMVWEQTVNYDGEPFLIRMNFTKNNN